MSEEVDYRTSLSIPPKALLDLSQRSLITSKSHPTLPISIHNYTDRAFKSSGAGKSDGYLIQACRSLITENATGLVVARSFSKFFNYHERFAYKPSGEEAAVMIEEKLDGSIISLFWYAGEWRVSSRASLDVDSPHVKAVWRFLASREEFMAVLGMSVPRKLKAAATGSKAYGALDKDKTYIFEFINPDMPIKVSYSKQDLFILAIIGKDGSEPSPSFDWTTLPFPRPRAFPELEGLLKTPKEISRLDRENEEGFVVKFWTRGRGEIRPERVKIKLEAYLKLLRPSMAAGSKEAKATANPSTTVKVDSKIKTILTEEFLTTPPTPYSILQSYRTLRLSSTSSFKPLFDSARNAHIAALDDSGIADDYGGDAWLEQVDEAWKRLDALVSLLEESWTEIMQRLESEGYSPGGEAGSASSSKKGVGKKGAAKASVSRTPFIKRVTKADVDVDWRPALLVWFNEVNASKKPSDGLKPAVWDAIEAQIPKALKSKEVILGI